MGEIGITLLFKLSTKLSTALSTKNKVLSTAIYVRLSSNPNGNMMGVIFILSKDLSTPLNIKIGVSRSFKFFIL